MGGDGFELLGRGVTTGAALFLGFLLLQRLSELVIARRNTARLLARGAREIGRGHYPVMVSLHASWLIALVVFGHDNPVNPAWLGVYAALQLFRVWTLTSLGGRWTTRVIVLDEPLVKRGPFRFMSHPNYMLVIAEVAVAPLVLGLGWVALLWSALNAAMLVVRVSAEEAALAPLRSQSRSADADASA